MIRWLYTTPARQSGSVLYDASWPANAKLPSSCLSTTMDQPVGFSLPIGSSTPADFSLAEAYAFCQRSVGAPDDTVVARALPVELRTELRVIGAFQNGAAAIANGERPTSDRLAELEVWEDDLRQAWHGEAHHPIFIALADTAGRHDLPITPFLDMIAACRMDACRQRHTSFESLRVYLECAAASSGRLLLALFGQDAPALDRYATNLSCALQLAHIVGDLRSDARRGRVYLPLEDLAHFEVTESDLAQGNHSAAVRDLVRFEVTRARGLLLRGRPLVDRLEGPLAEFVAAVWRRAMSLVARLESDRFSHALLAEAGACR